VAIGSISAFRQDVDIIKSDAGSDIALIKLADTASDSSPLKISRDPTLIGDPVTIVGYPFGSELTLLFGNISSLNEKDGMIRISATILPGQSGSPVLNKSGDVIAIVVGTYGRGAVVAAPIRLARQMLDQFRSGLNH
jgi:S1-C subfamily serine protease